MDNSGNANIIDSQGIEKSILNVLKVNNYNYYASPKGIKELRAEISNFLNRIWNYNVNYQNILITTGSQQSLNLVSNVLLKENDTIIIEQPTYFGALKLFELKNINMIGINVDEAGIDILHLESYIKLYKPKFIYVVPTFNNPTGYSWTNKNRKEFLKIINKYNIIVIEDDPYSLINYTDNNYETLYKLNKGLNVIYLGTFSKYISPSINVGYIIADDITIKKLYSYKEVFDLSTSLFNQLVILDYLKHNKLECVIKKKIPLYKKQLEHTIEYMKEKYKGINILIPKGGIFFLVEGLHLNELTKMYLIEPNKPCCRINICSIKK